MKTIPLTRGKVALVDDEDYETLSAMRWQARPSTDRKRWYAVRKFLIDGKRRWVFMHRFILQAPQGQSLDHWDGDGLNNQRSNLRYATPSQNSSNVRELLRNNTSGRRGVTWNKAARKWQAATRKNNKWSYIGVFDNRDDAARAYDKVALELFGDFASLNFPVEAQR